LGASHPVEVFLASDHHVKDVQVAWRDHFHHHLQQRAAQLARRPDEQRGPNPSGDAMLVELRLDESALPIA